MRAVFRWLESDPAHMPHTSTVTDARSGCGDAERQRSTGR